MSDVAREVRRVREAAGLFALPDRGVLAVQGSDRARWLNGMITNDVARLAPGPYASGCYAALLTPAGRIVTDLHVLLREDELWLEATHSGVAAAHERLRKLVIADDVRLVDRSEGLGRFAVEGPRARDVVCDALGEGAGGTVRELAPDACAEVHLAGVPTIVAAFDLCGEDGLQLFVPASGIECEAVRDALVEAGIGHGLVTPGADVLEVLRVEAGVPAFGSELSEEVLPPEAGLDRAISYTKGCYTGQEIIARLRSRGQVAHRLVGIAAQGVEPLWAGAPIEAAGERAGEITSAVTSPTLGAIGLAYLRRPHDAPGGAVRVNGRRARVVALPFVRRATPAPPPDAA